MSIRMLLFVSIRSGNWKLFKQWRDLLSHLTRCPEAGAEEWVSLVVPLWCPYASVFALCFTSVNPQPGHFVLTSIAHLTHDTYHIQQFLSLGPVGILGWTVHLGGSCPVHCGMFSNLPSLYPIDVTVDSTLPTVVTSTDVRHCQMFHGGENQPRLRNTDIQTQRSSAAMVLISFPSKCFRLRLCLTCSLLHWPELSDACA